MYYYIYENLSKNFTKNFVTNNFVYNKRIISYIIGVFDIQIDIVKILTILSNTEQL